MDKINKSVKTTFAFALSLSVGFPIGVLCVVFGAIKWIIPLLVIGIILVIAGFYVMPILWIKYGEKRVYRTIMYLIIHEHIHTVSGLSNQTSYHPDKIRKIINYLILGNYLINFLFHDDTLEINQKKNQTQKKSETKKCKHCGGMMQSDHFNFVCDYCGNVEKR